MAFFSPLTCMFYSEMNEAGHRGRKAGRIEREVGHQGERANKSQMPRVSRWSEKNSLLLRLSGVHTLIHLANAKLNIGSLCNDNDDVECHYYTFTRLMIINLTLSLIHTPKRKKNKTTQPHFLSDIIYLPIY